MTLMDDTWADNEQAAIKSTRHLQLWLSTISHIDPIIAQQVLEALNLLVVDAKWDVEYDENIGRYLLKDIK